MGLATKELGLDFFSLLRARTHSKSIEMATLKPGWALAVI